jgi:lipopolysaccharide transport system permease protein
MKIHSTSPQSLIQSYWINRGLIKGLIVREVLGRYRGSFLGIIWSFLNPVFMLIIYTFVFSIIFKARWNAESDSKVEFALILFVGLIVFNLFAECINRAPTLITSNISYVKKVVFPLEVLPGVALGSALVHSVISLVVWLLAYALLVGIPHPTVLLAPLVLLPLFLLTIGLSCFLASVGVYIRDSAQLTGMFTTVLLFLSPIFYPITAIPEKYRSLLALNPIAPMLEDLRNVLFWGVIPNVSNWLIYLCICTLVAWFGYAWFQKTRRGFADVL